MLRVKEYLLSLLGVFHGIRSESPDMETKKRVGLRIRAIRKQNELTQDQLAELLGRSVDAISNLERGLSHPSFETLERLSETLEVPVKAFFEFEGGSDISAKRAALLEELTTVAAQLKDKELEIGVKQLKALVR